MVGNLQVSGKVPERFPDVETEEKPKKYRDRRGYIAPSRLAKMEARKAAQFAEEKTEPAETSSKSGNRPPFLKEGRKLSASEATQLSEPFADSMTDYFQYIDQYLWSRQAKSGKSTGERPIWSNLDEEEMAALTRTMMKFGQHNAGAAAVVRGIIDGRDYFTAAMIFGPRIGVTRQILAETAPPKKERRV